MQLPIVKKQLIAATAVFGLAAAAMCGWAFWEGPVDLDESTNSGGVISQSDPGVVASATPERNFDKLLNLALRGPRVAVVEANVAPTVMASNRPAPFSIKLLGTVIEQGRALGLFQDAVGGFDVKAAGESLELNPNGVEIASIEAGVAVLRYAGKEIRLDLTSVAPTPSAAPAMNNELPMMEDGTTMVPQSVAPASAQPLAMPYGSRPSNGVDLNDNFSLPPEMDINNPANFGSNVTPTGVSDRQP